MVSFTGSTRAGVMISKAAAETIKRVALELGGKSPNVIFADSDLDGAVKHGVEQCFENTGQSCNAPTRMLVQNDVYEEAVELAAKHGSAVQVGNPREHGNHIGPLISQMQYDKVQSLIEAGIAEGARLVIGGPGRPEGFNRGYYAKPTIFADVNNQMRIAREEIFGPVLAMIPFKDEAEAIAIGNDTPFGLSAYVQTSNPATANKVSRALRAGMVRINGHGLSRGHPFGGYKQSGIGREGGKWGIEDFLETKIIGGTA
jgi:aldehyde dehydrogenase (NAD+)